MCVVFFFFQAEDGIRDLVRSRGLGDVYKRQASASARSGGPSKAGSSSTNVQAVSLSRPSRRISICLLYTSDAADERSSVDLGGRRIIKKKTNEEHGVGVRVGANTHNTSDISDGI